MANEVGIKIFRFFEPEPEPGRNSYAKAVAQLGFEIQKWYKDGCVNMAECNVKRWLLGGVVILRLLGTIIKGLLQTRHNIPEAPATLDQCQQLGLIDGSFTQAIAKGAHWSSLGLEAVQTVVAIPVRWMAPPKPSAATIVIVSTTTKPTTNSLSCSHFGSPKRDLRYANAA